MTLEPTEGAKELDTGCHRKGEERLTAISKSKEGAEFALRIKVSDLGLVSFICPEDIRVERLSRQWGIGAWSTKEKLRLEV